VGCGSCALNACGRAYRCALIAAGVHFQHKCIVNQYMIYADLLFSFIQGSECEYRHSDAARANPRDCWYWFNGNCANPKCSFRHPVRHLLSSSSSQNYCSSSQFSASVKQANITAVHLESSYCSSSQLSASVSESVY
jgi:hypothetical protein